MMMMYSSALYAVSPVTIVDFRLFREASSDVRCCWRFHLMKTALMSMVGYNFKEEIEKEEQLTKGLTRAAKSVKAAKDAKDRDVNINTAFDFHIA
jgi:hypothetical protein